MTKSAAREWGPYGIRDLSVSRQLPEYGRPGQTGAGSECRPELASSVSNMDDYDVILAGYPIWWHTAPMVIDTFLESYDLTGKKVIPFCTSAGSAVEESMPDIRRLGTSRGAEVGSGLTANSSSRSEIENWLQQNGVL